MKLIDRFRQWMIGRYGSDQLNIALLGVYLVISVLSTFVSSIILLMLSYVVIIAIFYRMFSRNITRRYEENQKFLQMVAPITKRISKNRGNRRNPYQQNPYQQNPYQSSSFGRKKKPKTDKNHKVFQCGKCGQMIRVPKGKGKIVITCPRCRQEFTKRT